jgi:hypothetical protein
MRTKMLVALLSLSGCASTTNEITQGDPLEVFEITGNPEAVAQCIAGEHSARGLRVPTTTVDVLRRADSWVVQLSGCTLIGCSLGKFPGGALVITEGRIESHRTLVSKWHREMPAVLEACSGAT